MHDVANGQLHYLPTLRSRNLGDLHDARGHVPRGRVAADVGADPVDGCLVERRPVAELHEQHDALVPLPLLADHEAFDHVGNLFDLTIDLRGADANATGIEDRVGSSVDDHAVAFRELDVVTVRPDAREPLEVGALILDAAGIVPEAERHRGEGRRADQLSFLFADRASVLIPDFDLHAERPALDLAAPHRPDRVPADEATDNVGASRDRGQVDVRLDVRIDEVKALGRQWRSG